jgi:hypothetical protein
MQQESLAPELTSDVKKYGAGRFWSKLFLIAAGIFVLAGLKNMYLSDLNMTAIGGDVTQFFNFPDLATVKGIGLIGAGIVCALVSVVMAIFDLADRQKNAAI